MSSSTEAFEEPDEPQGAPGRPARPVPAPRSTTGADWHAFVRLARPRQWVKNLLVFVAPAAAGVLSHGDVFGRTVAAFGIFCLAASGTYFLNDAIDAPADRRHPVKHTRPVASGQVPVRVALVVGSVMVAASVALGGWLAGAELAGVMAIYAAVNVAYSLGLRNEPIVDLALVSAGFVLRAIAGGVATGVSLSDWFLIVASFGSLLIVTGKRSGEQVLLAEHGSGSDGIRQTLGLYTPSFLRAVRTFSAAVTVTAYCLWSFQRAEAIHPGHHPIWFELTIIPFVIGLLHVLRLLDAGAGAAPEDLALHDHRLQVYGVAWAVLFAIGVYAR
ncbi:MAG: decaprenyl-phosphate phosphoribosyltransferase [Acidimicrobiales bacterium]|nr:decaprenyl-phosphate phosphoribosyltransferase [Acidimicrobiales bacterium]